MKFMVVYDNNVFHLIFWNKFFCWFVLIYIDMLLACYSKYQSFLMFVAESDSTCKVYFTNEGWYCT